MPNHEMVQAGPYLHGFANGIALHLWTAMNKVAPRAYAKCKTFQASSLRG
jgi:hypothetical protein